MRPLNTIYILLFALLFAGCEMDHLYDDYESSSDVVMLNLGITTKSTEPDNNSLGLAEDEINTLRVFVFDGGGALEKQQFFNSSDAVDGVYRMEIERSDDKDLYFVVNEPSGISSQLEALNNNSYASALRDIDFAIADFFNAVATNGNVEYYELGDFSMPMSASKMGVVATQDLSFTVEVTRCVARLDLYLSMGARDAVELTSGTFKVEGLHDDAFVIAPIITPTGSADKDVEVGANGLALTKESQRVLSLYMAERKYDYVSSPITISLTSTNSDVATPFEIYLGDPTDELTSELSEIKRNYIYRVNVEYDAVATEAVIADYKIMEWDVVYVDGDMGGVILAVDGVVAMDWFRNGYSYTSPAAAFGGDRDIEILVPQARYDDGTYLYISNNGVSSLDITSTSSYSSRNLLGLTSYDEDATLGWLTSARLSSSGYVGHMTFTYEPMDIPYENESFPIRVKSENVIKTMMVVYDNGYISQEYIPTEEMQNAIADAYPGIEFDWVDGITNGFIVAKRGYQKHPATTEDVKYAVKYDDEEYYYTEEGTFDYTAGSDPETDYCKKLGSDWYLPTVDMLRVVQLKGQELGTSYRFQNTSGTLYLGVNYNDDGTVSYKAVPMDEAYIGDVDTYWSDLAPKDVEENKTYQIRCFLNM